MNANKRRFLILLVGLALAATAQEKKKIPKGTMVRAVTYKVEQGLSQLDLAAELKVRGGAVETERPFESGRVERSKRIIREIYSERDDKIVIVRAETQDVPPSGVNVLFTVAAP